MSSDDTSGRRHAWIDQQGDLESVIDDLIEQPAYAIDTEFHRERTYFPALALVQLGWEDELVLVDPLAVDVTALKRLFESGAEAVFHAAQQDFDVLNHAVGSVPAKFFDTQVAGGFLGYGTPSLVSLLSGEMGVNPPKGDRLTDWLRRPLTETQREYAASDVAYLLELRDLLVEQLIGLGRLDWVYEACAELRLRPTSGTNPEDAWAKLKDARSLRPRARAVAQAVAAWRERAAMQRNIPVRQILPDLAVLGISQRQPSTEKELSQARGVDERFSRGKLSAEILAAVAEGKHAEPPDARPGGEDLDRDLRPAVTLISAWVSQVARTERIDAAILGDPRRSRLVSGERPRRPARQRVARRTARRGRHAPDRRPSRPDLRPRRRPQVGRRRHPRRPVRRGSRRQLLGAVGHHRPAEHPYQRRRCRAHHQRLDARGDGQPQHPARPAREQAHRRRGNDSVRRATDQRQWRHEQPADGVLAPALPTLQLRPKGPQRRRQLRHRSRRILAADQPGKARHLGHVPVGFGGAQSVRARNAGTRAGSCRPRWRGPTPADAGRWPRTAHRPVWCR